MSDEERALRALGRLVIPGPVRGRADAAALRSFRPPGPLGDRGRQIWRELTRALSRAGILREGHARKLWILCGALEKLEQIREFVRTSEEKRQKLFGVVWRTKSGYPMRAPWFDAEMKLCEIASKLLSEFGLGGGAATEEPQKEDSEALLKGWQNYARSTTIVGTRRMPDTARM